VTAVTAQQRDVVGITTIQDLSNFTPGMTRTGADRISLRGTGRFTFFLGSDPGVATYSDGFYSQNFTLEAYKSPLFIQRTEILRGPQGTLYGRNSMGGSLNVVSARPTDEFQAELRGVVGNYDSRKIEGSVSGPITDTLRYRLVGQVDQQSEGFLENYGPSGNEAQWDRTYQEAQLDWDATPWLHFWLRATTSTWDDTMGVEDRLVSYLSPFETNQFNAPAAIILSPQYNYCNTPGVAAPNPFLGQTPGTDECNINGGGGAAPNRSLTLNDPYLFEADTRDVSFDGRYSRGYKAGGFSLGTASSDPFYDPEEVNSYEIGAKRDFGRTLRTNLALFFNDYKGFQFNLGGINPDTGFGESLAINVDAETYGAELEVIWEPVENLMFSAAYGYLHDEITGPGCSVISPGVFSSGCFFDTADVAAVAPGAQPVAGAMVVSPGALFPSVTNQSQSLVGNGLPQTPEHKLAVNANYTFHTDLGSVTLSASGFYTDEVSYGVFENPQYKVDSYSTADFRALFNDDDGRFTVITYVKNAFEEEAFTSNGPLNPGQRYIAGSGVPTAPSAASTERGLIYPRTYGVELQFHF
jgi:outer membrane receptor protein involved in Fe transport